VANTTSTRRSYVTETKPREHAQVQTDHAIRLDSNEFDKAGLSIRSGQDGSSEHVSPMADVLSQATKMDEGQRPIYLDMQATTPLDPRVLDAMLPFYTGFYGNPHSRTHAYGWESEKGVEDAREHIAALIGADPKEIIFTSGATESNNMSIKGVARFFGRGGKKKHIITSQTEHKCVLDSCRHLQDEGFEVTYLPVNNNGLIDLDNSRKPSDRIPCWSASCLSTTRSELFSPSPRLESYAGRTRCFFTLMPPRLSARFPWTSMP